MVDGWRYDFGSFRSGLGLPSHKLCGDPTDMDKRGDALIQEGQARQRAGAVATRLGLPLRIDHGVRKRGESCCALGAPTTLFRGPR